jgi:hypothetical protein
VLLPAAQAVLGLGALGGLVLAVLHARALSTAGGQAGGPRADWAAKALAGAWLLAFAVLTVVGVYHHLIGFNQNF